MGSLSRFRCASRRPDLSLRNDLRIRKLTPPAGVDVVVGRRQLIVDGSYHSLRRLGNPSLRRVYWLPPRLTRSAWNLLWNMRAAVEVELST